MKFFSSYAGAVDGYCCQCPGMVQSHNNRKKDFRCIECGIWQDWREARGCEGTWVGDPLYVTQVFVPSTISLMEWTRAKWLTERDHQCRWDCVVDAALDRILSRVEVRDGRG